MKATWCPRSVIVSSRPIQARIWIALRLYVDRSGCGHIPWNEAVQGLARVLHIGEKYAAKLLRKEAGLLWTIGPNDRYVHLAGVKSLGLESDIMVQCPIEVLASPRNFRSYIYCLTLNKHGGPLTRWDVSRQTGVGRTSQWTYEKTLQGMGYSIIRCPACLYMNEHDEFKMTPNVFYPIWDRMPIKHIRRKKI